MKEQILQISGDATRYLFTPVIEGYFFRIFKMGKFYLDTSRLSSPTQHRGNFPKNFFVFHSILWPLQPLNGKLIFLGDFFQCAALQAKKAKSTLNIDRPKAVSTQPAIFEFIAGFNV